MIITGKEVNPPQPFPQERTTLAQLLSHQCFSLQLMARPNKHYGQPASTRNCKFARKKEQKSKTARDPAVLEERCAAGVYPRHTIAGLSNLIGKTRASNLERMKKILFGEKLQGSSKVQINSLRLSSCPRQERAPVQTSQFALQVKGNALRSTKPPKTHATQKREGKSMASNGNTSTTQVSLQLDNLDIEAMVLKQATAPMTCHLESSSAIYSSRVNVWDLNFEGRKIFNRASQSRCNRKYSLEH